MGTVYRRGDSKFWWLDFVGPDGQRHQRSSKKTDETAALALLSEIEGLVEKQSATAPAPLKNTVAKWTAEWAEARVAKGKHTNAKLDARALEQHVASAQLVVHGKPVAFGKLRLEEVRPLHVRAWLEFMEGKKLAANTVLSVYSLLRRALQGAVREELLDSNPCQLERGELPRLSEADPDGRPEEAMFSLKELEQLISDMRLPLDRRVGYAVSCLGGLRQGELAALTWADYDQAQQPLGRLYVSKSYTRKNKRVKSTKSGVTRWVPVHRASAALLAEWKLTGWVELFGRAPLPADLLLPNRAGRFLTDLNLWGNLQHDLEALGWAARSFHDTRATFCTYAVAAGSPWEVVKHISHGVKRRSRSMAQVYVRPPWEMLCDVVSRIKLQLRGTTEVVPLQATGTLRSVVTVDGGDDATTRQDNPKPSMPRARFEVSPSSIQSSPSGTIPGGSGAASAPSRPQESSDRNADVTFPEGEYDPRVGAIVELLLPEEEFDDEAPVLQRARRKAVR